MVRSAAGDADGNITTGGHQADPSAATAQLLSVGTIHSPCSALGAEKAYGSAVT